MHEDVSGGVTLVVCRSLLAAVHEDVSWDVTLVVCCFASVCRLLLSVLHGWGNALFAQQRMDVVASFHVMSRTNTSAAITFAAVYRSRVHAF